MKIRHFLVLAFLSASAQAGEPYAIEVVDSRTARGVPLVELRTAEVSPRSTNRV
jgi:hypothetical protein